MFNRFFLLIILCIHVSNLAIASDIKNLRVGVEAMNYYPVMDFTTPQHRGLLSDIMTDFGNSHNISFEFIPLPLQRFNHWFEDNAIDFRLPDNPRWTQSSTAGLVYGEPLITVCDTSVVLTTNSDIPMDEVTRLGLLYGFTPAEKWQEKRSNGTLTIANERSVRILTRMLVNGLVDAIDLNIATVKNELMSLGLSEELVAVAKNVPANGVQYRISTRLQHDVLSKLNAYVSMNRDSINAKALEYGIAAGTSCD
jgi:polar amino acid transport system substrate-binding protein